MARPYSPEEAEEDRVERQRATLANAWEGVALVVFRSDRPLEPKAAEAVRRHLRELVRPYSEAPIAVLEPGMSLELQGKEGQPYGVLEVSAEAVGLGEEAGEEHPPLPWREA